MSPCDDRKSDGTEYATLFRESAATPAGRRGDACIEDDSMCACTLENTDIGRRLSLSGVEDIRPAREAVQRIAQCYPFDQRQVADIALAVSEACVNGVRYASVDGAEPVVTVTASTGEDHLAFEVRDFGSGFTPHPPRMPDPAAESGRGIALMHALMDHVAITSTCDGTRVRMVKYFAR